jgi:hypothetical protein
LHSPPPSGMDDHETPHVAFECTIAPRLGLKFRDFFRAYSNPPLRFVASEQARNLDGEGERGERNASRASFSLLPFLFAFGFPKKTFFSSILSGSLSDGASDIYIKQAPLVIINERMNYCEFNFSRLARPFIGELHRRKEFVRPQRRRINSLDSPGVVSVK